MLLIIPKRPFAKFFTRDVQKCYYSFVQKPALRVLFCGSDDFSIASLQALNNLRKATGPSVFASIDVVCRPGKLTGRGLKIIRDVPIKSVAHELELPVHEIDTFTGWDLPRSDDQSNINLIIAVSFGLFVPPRILRRAKYGGINVHPSLLPDFRGPAPLQHTLLAGEKYTGVTIQTLGETGFDQGQILSQTSSPGLRIPKPETITYSELLDHVTPIASDMLSKYVKNTYLRSHDEIETGNEFENTHLRHAPKITKADTMIDWENWTAEEISRRYRALGRLWTTVGTNKEGSMQRVIIEELENFKEPVELLHDSYKIKGLQEPIWKYKNKSIVVLTGPNREPILVKSITIAGKKRQDASVLCSWGINHQKKDE